MIRLPTLAILAAVSCLATPVMVRAMGATPGDAPAARAEAPAVAAPRADEAPCARRVRVVYAGYGEGAACR